MNLWTKTACGLTMATTCFMTLYGGDNNVPLPFSELRNLGPGGGGTLGALSMAQDNSDVIYAGLDCGGLHATVNNGKSWKNINTGIKYDHNISFNDHYGILGLEKGAALCTADSGKIYRSEDYGKNWEIAFTDPRGIAIGQIIRKPKEPQTVYAVNGRSSWENFSEVKTAPVGWGWGGNIYVSSREGKVGSWRKLNTADQAHNIPGDAHIAGLAVDPGNAEKMYAVTNYGMYRSSDGGVSWTSIQNGLGKAVAKAVVSPVPNTVLISFGGDLPPVKTGVYKSTDAGNTWKYSSEGLVGDRFAALSVDPRNPNYIYAGSWAWGGGIFRSIDGGDHWTPFFNKDIMQKLAGRNPVPFNAWHDGMHVSCGISLISGGPDRNGNGISDVLMFSGDNMGIIWKSDNEGKSWSQLTTTQTRDGWVGKGEIQLLCARKIMVDPRNTRHLLVVDWDYGVFESIDGGEHFGLAGGPWYNGQLLSGSGSITLDPDNLGIVYCGGRGGIICRYPDKFPGGFFNIFAGFKNGDRGLPSSTSYVNGMVILKLMEGNRKIKYLYAAGNNSGIWRINLDAPQSKFENVSTGLGNSPEARAFNSLVTSSPSGTLFAGSMEGICRSTDGKNWQKITGTNTAYPIIDGLIDLAVDPLNPNRIYASRMKTYRESPGDGIYCSEDLGNSWKLLAELTMPYCVAVIPGKVQSVLTGSQATGVSRLTRTASGQWKTENLTEGYPSERVTRVWGITVNPNNPKHIFIATHGNFIYEGRLK